MVLNVNIANNVLSNQKEEEEFSFNSFGPKTKSFLNPFVQDQEYECFRKSLDTK